MASTLFAKGLRTRARTAAFVAVVISGANAHASISASPTPNTTGDYTVSWTPAAGAQWYILRESTNGGSSWSGYFQTSSTSKSFTDEAVGSYMYDLQKCYEYYDRYMELITSCGHLYGTATAVVNAPPPPPIPAGLSVPQQDYNGSYSISWNSVSGAASYRLQEKKGSGTWNQIYQSSGTSHAVSGRSPGTYYYRVRACNSHPTCSNWSASVSLTVAAAPSLFRLVECVLRFHELPASRKGRFKLLGPNLFRFLHQQGH